MKKLSTLLMLVMLSMTAWAGDVYKITFNGKNAEFKNGEEVTAGTFFSWNSAKHNFNTKFTDASWDDTNFTSGLKMEGSTKVSFSSTAEATVTIVQSTWSDKTIRFDGSELPSADAAAGTGCRIYTITNVAAGNHEMTRGSGESGVFAIKVEYTGTQLIKLATPEITVNATNGEVTIGAVANATEVRYTTDGSNPDEMNGDVYSDPFTVTDGTVVKAIAIGMDNYLSSEVASKQVLIEGTVPVAPTIVSQAGAVAITCATPAVTIEYSTNNVDFVKYTCAFYLYEDATVYARAKRGDKTSEVAQFAFKAVAIPEDFEEVVVIQIPEGTDANSFAVEGCKLTITGNAAKKYSLGGNKIVIDGVEHNAAKLSNGAQNTLKLPEGKKAVGLTLYSYVNAASTGARTTGWSEVNGVSYDVKEAPMGAFTDVAVQDSKVTDPDVRSYLIDGKNEITFTNTGEQLCFMAVVYVAGENTTIPTAISEVKSAATNATVYNLAGQKVNAAFKGLVVKNGKKVIVK